METDKNKNKGPHEISKNDPKSDKKGEVVKVAEHGGEVSQ